MYAGGISPHKGIHVLLDAFKIVAAQYPDVRLDIIGPQGSYPLEETFDLRDRALIKDVASFYAKNRLSLLKSKLSRVAQNSDRYLPYLQSKITGAIADKVAFLGMIPRPELIQHYYDADLFVFPPIWDEGFGIPPVEAMAAGVPVVATRSGAIVETVQHGETGLLVEKNDPRALAQALLTLLTDDALRERMGRAGRLRATTRFTWDCAAAKMHSLYHALCSDEAGKKTNSTERLSLARHP
jgi:glycosyltransferase involved in cell wall biosynthesis